MAEFEASKTYRVAVVGDRDSVLGFMALGYRVEIAPDVIAAREAVERLAREDDVAVIFLTEGYAAALADTVDAYRSNLLPAIVPIPSADGDGAGYGERALHRAVERAVGADILS